jgi:hypothetical protein
MSKKIIKTQKELATDLNCEELCVLSKKKDFIEREINSKTRTAVSKERENKVCPVC